MGDATPLHIAFWTLSVPEINAEVPCAARAVHARIKGRCSMGCSVWGTAITVHHVARERLAGSLVLDRNMRILYLS